MSYLTELIVAPCHTGYRGRTVDDAHDPNHYVGLFGCPPYHCGLEEIQLYIDHAQQATILAGTRKNSLLMFSGGCTRKKFRFGETEALGYLQLADQHDFWGYRHSLRGRVSIETRARDSFENVQCSVKLFSSLCGYKPKAVTVVGFSFKRNRFYLHADTVNNTSDGPFKFDFIGSNDPPVHVLETSLDGEREALSQFQKCPHGNEGKLLEKRIARDPHGYYVNST